MLQRIRHNKIALRMKAFLQKINLWETVLAFYEVQKILINKLIHFDIDQRASAVAYSFILAVFPAIIFLFTLIPYVPYPNFDKQLLNFLEEIIPSGIYGEAKVTIEEIVSKPRGDILSLGFLLSLYAATSGMMALMGTFNMTYQTKEKRGFFKSRLIATMLTFLLAFVLLIAILVLIVGRILLDILLDVQILNANWVYYGIQITRFVTVFMVSFVAVSVIYRWAPAIHKKWRFFSIGSITASILIILITNLFSFYISNFAAYNRLYGSIGAFIALMIWMYLIALVLILGFEINASLDHARNEGRLPKRKNATPQ